MGNIDRKEEVISTCLEQFVKKGLYRTTSRDLSKALKLQSAGLYYYFTTKDEAVITCAEEASFLLEDAAACAQAQKIAQTMQEELDEQRKEDQVLRKASCRKPS